MVVNSVSSVIEEYVSAYAVRLIPGISPTTIASVSKKLSSSLQHCQVKSSNFC